jgi:outer membrane lipoprotein SlyB
MVAVRQTGFLTSGCYGCPPNTGGNTGTTIATIAGIVAVGALIYFGTEYVLTNYERVELIRRLRPSREPVTLQVQAP